MRLKKTLLLVGALLAVLPGGSLLLGCTDENNCGYGAVPPYFKAQAVELAARRRTTGQPLLANESVAVADLLLELRLQKTYYGHHQPRRLHLLPAAYACPPMPVPGYLGTRETLDSLVVRSRYAYNAQHPAGTSLNDLLLETDAGQLLTARGS